MATELRIYRRCCRRCNEFFDSLVRSRATCDWCRLGIQTPPGEKLFTIVRVPLERKRRSRSDGGTRPLSPLVVDDRWKRKGRTYPNDPLVKGLIDACVQTLGSKRAVEHRAGLSDGQLCKYYRGRPVHESIIDALCIIAGWEHLYSTFDFSYTAHKRTSDSALDTDHLPQETTP